MKEPTSPTAPLAAFPPQPEEYRSRAAEFYGFVAWSSTYLLSLLFILWSFLPDEWIVWSGVTWYPNREWALLFPAWSMVLVLLTYFTYFSLALFATPAFSDISTITDSMVVSLIQPHLTSRTKRRRRRCTTYQSHWSITPCMIAVDGKKNDMYLLREYRPAYTM